MDELFQALSDRSRRELLERLFERNGQTVGELCDGLQMTRQAVSKHLALLEGGEVVEVDKPKRIAIKWQHRSTRSCALLA